MFAPLIAEFYRATEPFPLIHLQFPRLRYGLLFPEIWLVEGNNWAGLRIYTLAASARLCRQFGLEAAGFRQRWLVGRPEGVEIGQVYA
jgi:hypothetical protein